MDLICVVVVFLIILIVWMSYDDTTTLCESDKCYKVVSHFSEQDKAVKYLAYMDKFVSSLILYMKNKYVDNSDDEYKKNMTILMMNNYNSAALRENNPSTQRNTSYVQNKGEVFALCLREKVSGMNKLHDISILEFVTLHELAHLSTHLVEHEREFWYNFKILLQEAKEAGLHSPVNYAKNPVAYCSVNVTYNPYYDTKL